MTATARHEEEPVTMPADPERMQAEIDAAIASCGGDMRTTIAALLADNRSMEKELNFAGLAMSYGFSRGWFARQRDRRQAVVTGK